MSDKAVKAVYDKVCNGYTSDQLSKNKVSYSRSIQLNIFQNISFFPSF
jgi:hypothetical protein